MDDIWEPSLKKTRRLFKMADFTSVSFEIDVFACQRYKWCDFFTIETKKQNVTNKLSLQQKRNG